MHVVILGGAKDLLCGLHIEIAMVANRFFVPQNDNLIFNI